VVGKGFAILETGRVRLSGFVAWLAWAGVHLQFVGQSNLRTSVLLQWIWTYVTGRRGARLIVNRHGSAGDAARSTGAIRPAIASRIAATAP